MKTTLLLFLFFLHSTFNHAQKWHLEKVNPEHEFKFEYWFSFQNEDDKSVIEIIETPNQKDNNSITGVITASNDEPIPYSEITVSIIIKDNFGNTVSVPDTNSKGEFYIERQFENFEISVSTNGYDALISKINLKRGFNTNLKIKLGKAPELTVYQINSKTELSPDEISEIINCVKKNRDLNDENYLMKCTGKKFRLSMQI